MTQATCTITFEAVDQADAVEQVQSWNLPAGASVLLSVQESVTVTVEESVYVTEEPVVVPDEPTAFIEEAKEQ